MYLLKRPNGFYYVVCKNNGKKQYVTTKCKLKSQANEFLRNFVMNQATKQNTSLRLSEYIHKYLEHTKATHSINTYNSETVLFCNLLKFLENKYIHEITPKDIDSFIERKLSDGTKPVTVRSYLGTISGLFSKAVKWGFIESNPVVKATKPHAIETTPAVFTKEEFRRLFHLLPSDDILREIVIFDLQTALRISEIINLKWDSVNFELQTIKVESENSKNKKSRIIPMSQEVEKLLSMRKEKMTGEYVFSDNSGKPLDRESISKRFKKYIRRAGLCERLHFHSLRASALTFLAQSGESIFLISKYAGHSDTRVTQKHYLNIACNDLVKLSRKLNFIG